MGHGVYTAKQLIA